MALAGCWLSGRGAGHPHTSTAGPGEGWAARAESEQGRLAGWGVSEEASARGPPSAGSRSPSLPREGIRRWAVGGGWSLGACAGKRVSVHTL